VRALWCSKPPQGATRNESDFIRDPQGATELDPDDVSEGFEVKHIRWDPKDGELFPGRSKPGETLVEDRTDTDVQIVRQIWVKGRKTHRAI